MGVVIWLITKFSPHYAASEIGRGLDKLDHAMLYAIGSIFSQGTNVSFGFKTQTEAFYSSVLVCGIFFCLWVYL